MSPAAPAASFTTLREGGSSLVLLAGELDVRAAPRLRRCMESAVDRSNVATVDATAVRVLDAAALDVLVEAQRRAARAGCRLRVEVGRDPPEPAVVRLLHVALLHVPSPPSGPAGAARRLDAVADRIDRRQAPPAG